MSFYFSEHTRPTPWLESCAPIAGRLFAQLGIDTEEGAEAFLSPSYERDLHDPFTLVGMSDAIDRIDQAIKKGEHIVVYADYDCDGIPGAVIAHDFFALVGYTNVSWYIPDRHAEGYGLHQDALVECIDGRGASLIVTIDLGSTNHEAIEYAESRGVNVIVTDHHILPEVLPQPFALINPKQRAPVYGDPMLCGSGVFFKLVQAFLSRYGASYNVASGREKWLLDMVGFATLADMVPLVGENRVLAYFGLKVLKKTPRLGLSALLQLSKVNKSTLTEDDLTFMVAPRINAASRMDHPMRAFALLIERDPVEASRLAKELEALNTKRKNTTKEVMKKVQAKMDAHRDAPVIVVGDRSFGIGILGLVASRIVEEYKKPAFVWGSHDSLTIKGSCRSEGETNVVALMRALPEGTLITGGGHEGAGGFAVALDAIHLLDQRINATYCELYGDIPRVVTQASYECLCPLTLKDLSSATWRTLGGFAPFGVGNPKPLFAWQQCTVLAVRQFGKTKEHLELTLQDATGTGKAMAFFATSESYSVPVVAGMQATIIGTFDHSTFAGKTEYRIRLIAVLPV